MFAGDFSKPKWACSELSCERAVHRNSCIRSFICMCVLTFFFFSFFSSFFFFWGGGYVNPGYAGSKHWFSSRHRTCFQNRSIRNNNNVNNNKLTIFSGKKTRQTEEEVGRQHLGIDRPGVRQVPEGNGEQGKMEETGCELICGAPTTLAVKG